MKKVIGFELHHNIEYGLLQDLCNDIFHDFELELHNNFYVTLSINSDELFLLKTLKSYFEDSGFNLTGVISYEENQILRKALDIAKVAAANQIMHVADIILLESIHGQNSLIKQIDLLFKDTSFDHVITAKTFIEHGCNALLASEALFIHRNTFSYRLNKFIDQTNLDIRDFHNARLFQSWLILQHHIK